jgi:2-haloacid dehalogenase
MTIQAFVFDAYGTLFDVQSVYEVTEQEFPGHGDLITQVWRLKQLEYTWLRSQMQAYRSFWQISGDSLAYTLKAIGLSADPSAIARIMDKYLHLDPYPDCLAALDALKDVPLAILSNGNQEILDALVKNTGLDTRLNSVISVDKAGVFKPHPTAYELVEKTLNLKPQNVMFVSSNAFDASAAKSFGFQVAWIERMTPQAMAAEVASKDVVGPSTMFKLLRMQWEALDTQPDHRLTSLSDLANLQKS